MNSKFRQIYGYLNRRKKLLNKANKAACQLEKWQREIDENELPFKSGLIDVEKYRDFFNTHYIAMGALERFDVKEIKLTNDYQGNLFYDMKYEYVRKDQLGKVVDRHQGLLSLRKFLHLLDQPKAELKEK